MLKHMLAPLDGSSLAECVLPHVVAVGRACGSPVTLLRVVERAQAPASARYVDPLGWYMGAAEARAYLDNLTASLREAGLQAESTLLEGQAAERITEFVRSEDVDMIVLSSHGRSGLSGWNVSSIVLKVILRACVPVMIVRAYQPVIGDPKDLRYHRLLVPLDCSQRAECVLPLATTMARYHEAELLVVNVVSRPQMPRRAPSSQEDIELANRVVERNRQEAMRYLEQIESQLGVDVQTLLLTSDNAAAALHDLVEQAQVDLVLLSAHGYSGGTRWPYGSLVLNFIGYGTTPLLIVQDLSQDELRSTKAELAAREHRGH